MLIRAGRLVKRKCRVSSWIHFTNYAPARLSGEMSVIACFRQQCSVKICLPSYDMADTAVGVV